MIFLIFIDFINYVNIFFSFKTLKKETNRPLGPKMTSSRLANRSRVRRDFVTRLRRHRHWFQRHSAGTAGTEVAYLSSSSSVEAKDSWCRVLDLHRLFVFEKVQDLGIKNLDGVKRWYVQVKIWVLKWGIQLVFIPKCECF